MRCALSDLVTLEAPTRVLLEDCWRGRCHTRRVADRWALSDGEWIPIELLRGNAFVLVWWRQCRYAVLDLGTKFWCLPTPTDPFEEGA